MEETPMPKGFETWAEGDAGRDFSDQGFCIIPGIIPTAVLDELARFLEALSIKAAAGARNLAQTVPVVARLAESREIAYLLEDLGAPGAFLVRSIFFDKKPGANWKVPWHQDLTIAVRERREVAGFGPWSEKAGVPHVQPPAEVLQRMVTLRLHLDDCDADNGALRVFPRSHRHGVLGPGMIRQWREAHVEVLCTVPRGGILAMRPLLLHASSRSLRPAHRRVIHLEFATGDLPGGLEWK
jgi:ectoine hydroxylase-related dioxygenase (phytanoyl-CoA dioxygenase family)